MGRLAYDLHRGVVHEHEFQLHFGVPGRHILRDLPPQARGFEHVGLVHDRQAPPAAHGEPECDVQHAFDLRARVGAGVESLRPGFVAPLRPAEIDAARQFAHADEIGAAHHLCLERPACRTMRWGAGWRTVPAICACAAVPVRDVPGPWGRCRTWGRRWHRTIRRRQPGRWRASRRDRGRPWRRWRRRPLTPRGSRIGVRISPPRGRVLSWPRQ